MLIKLQKVIYQPRQQGFTLIELISFIVVMGLIVVSLSAVFRQAMTSLEEPTVNSKILDLAYSQLNTVLSRRFDENTPDNGTPCDFTVPCAGIGLDAGESLSNSDFLDDVDDFNGYSDIPETGFTRIVRVSNSGTLFGILDAYAKRVDVSVTASSGESIVVTAYKVNQ
ncbi:MAG: type IV pilus modification PilV family protein [Cellvibrionaceae bacterium]